MLLLGSNMVTATINKSMEVPLQGKFRGTI